MPGRCGSGCVLLWRLWHPKIGTTLLVLDAIEAGELLDMPRLRRPLQALRAISADPDLQTSVPLAGGSHASALEIQRLSLNAWRRFLNRRAAAHVGRASWSAIIVPAGSGTQVLRLSRS